MKKSPLPYKRMIFVCTNARPAGQRVSCAGEGRCGEFLLERLKSEVKARGLKEVIRVAKSGCQEQCELGPNAVVVPENVILHGLTEADLPALIETYLAPLSASASETRSRPS